MAAVGIKPFFPGARAMSAIAAGTKFANDPPRAQSKPVHILIACMPKSGSTFLSDVISHCPGIRRGILTPSAGRREQEIDEQLLSKLSKVSFVAQHHVRNSDWTAEMCRTYGVAPVVLVRSLQDVVVSLRDHMRRESAVFPQFFADASHAALNDADLEQVIAKLALPWYLNFYMSWRNAPGALMVNYEDLASRPVETIREVLRFSGARLDVETVKDAIDKAKARECSRMNVGVSGRGDRLQPATLQTILELINLYPEAADDPYICSVKEQATAALAGTPPPARRPERPAPALAASHSGARKRLGKREMRFLVHWVAPALLVTLGLSYWAWPFDLIPDHSAYGYADDATVMLVSSFLAGIFHYKKV